MICDAPVQTYYEYVMPYRDSFGLIAQSPADNRDGGDSAHRLGVFYYGLWELFKDQPLVEEKIYQDFKTDLAKITIGPGQFVRHPDPTKWYSNPNNFTRDQSIPLIVALGAFNRPADQSILWSNLHNVLHNGGFFPNKLKNWTNEEKVFPFDYNDPAGPSDYGLYIRALRIQKYRWFLWVGDALLLGNSFLRIAYSYFDNTDTSNDLNFTLHLLQAKNIWPTWFSHFAYRIYFQGRLMSPLTPEDPYPQSGVESAWNYYFRKSAHSPPLNKIYQCIINQEFHQ